MWIFLHLAFKPLLAVLLISVSIFMGDYAKNKGCMFALIRIAMFTVGLVIAWQIYMSRH